MSRHALALISREEEQSGEQENRCRHMHADSEDEEKGDTEPSDQSDE
jgi:hypothetical protein